MSDAVDVLGPLNMGGNQINDVANGSASTDAVAYGQVFGGDLSSSAEVTSTHLADPLPVAQGGTGLTAQTPGLTPQLPVIMAPVKWVICNYDSAQHDLTTQYTYDNGTDGVGATVTSNVNGVLVADSGNPAVGDRILVVDPYAWGTGNPPHADGIYTVTSIGSDSAPYVLTRSTDCDTAATLCQFWAVTIEQGTIFGGGRAAVQAIPIVPLPFVVGTTFPGFSLSAPAAYSAGPWNTATLGGVALGSQATAVGDNSVAIGNTASTTATFSTALGAYSSANGQGAVTIGYQSFANGADSVTLGAFSVAYANGQLAEASNYANVEGDSQGTRWYPNGGTTDATPTNLTASFNKQLIINGYGGNADYTKTMLFNASVVARRIDVVGTDSAWTMQGVLRGDGSGTYSWVGGSAPTATLVAQDSAASAWAVAVSVSGNTLSITVTGAAGETILWVAQVETVEIAG